MNLIDIKNYFEQNISKKTIEDLSYDSANNNSLVISNKFLFDFDSITDKIKTSDALFFEKSNIIFIEFKNGKINDIDFRLKATESVISFINLLLDKNLVSTFSLPSDTFQFYIVYNINKYPTKAIAFRTLEEKIKLQYKYLLSKYRILNQDQFKKRFKSLFP